MHMAVTYNTVYALCNSILVLEPPSKNAGYALGFDYLLVQVELGMKERNSYNVVRQKVAYIL